jgi:hypothetical protein
MLCGFAGWRKDNKMTKLTMSGNKDNIEYFIDDEPVPQEQYEDMIKYLGGSVAKSDSSNVLCAEHNDTEDFKKKLECLINEYSIENKCDVPDFILAEMVISFIEAIGPKIKQTLDWHGCDSVCHPGA